MVDLSGKVLCNIYCWFWALSIFLLVVSIMPWVLSDDSCIIAGIFVLLSVAITLRQIYQHLKHYYCPSQQKWIVRILFMVPIYALSSWLSLKFHNHAIYFDTIRNVYEGITFVTSISFYGMLWCARVWQGSNIFYIKLSSYIISWLCAMSTSVARHPSWMLF